MKKQTFRTITMLSLALMLTAGSVCAQSDRSGILNIPFNFIVGGKTLPAGEYTVEPNKRDSHNVWLVQSREGKANALFATMSVRADQTQEETKLVFHKYGDQYFLSQVWMAGSDTGRDLFQSRNERNLAKELKLAKSKPEHQKVILTAGKQ